MIVVAVNKVHPLRSVATVSEYSCDHISEALVVLLDGTNQLPSLLQPLAGVQVNALGSQVCAVDGPDQANVAGHVFVQAVHGNVHKAAGEHLVRGRTPGRERLHVVPPPEVGAGPEVVFAGVDYEQGVRVSANSDLAVKLLQGLGHGAVSAAQRKGVQLSKVRLHISRGQELLDHSSRVLYEMRVGRGREAGGGGQIQGPRERAQRQARPGRDAAVEHLFYIVVTVTRELIERGGGIDSVAISSRITSRHVKEPTPLFVSRKKTLSAGRFDYWRFSCNALDYQSHKSISTLRIASYM